MCGVVAVFYPDSVDPPIQEELKDRLEKSLETIKYRGPDSQGVYISPDARVGLGHARLSIIDLSTGQQPLSDEEEFIHCIVNGEIYDHDRIRAEMQSQGYSFKTKSDSELVVQLYKRDGFNLTMHLRGEFAFVLYDLKRRLLFAARDRFGIKPLYYTVHDGCVMFGSEIKAFMGLGWKAEWDVESIVHNAELSDERTIFRGVQKLPAGHLAICRPSGHIQTQAFWDLTYPHKNAVPQPEETIEKMASTVREHLVEAVRLRLRSDVPLAVYLSGGIDSSSVAGIATHLLRQQNKDAKLTTFTLSYIEDPSTDETPLAERTAAFIDANLVKVEATEARLVGAFEETVWHAEQPAFSFHSAGKSLLSKAVRDAGYKVVLTGEGSDEIFAGYPWFPMDYCLDEDPAGAAILGQSTLPTAGERRAEAEAYHAATGLPLRPLAAYSPHKSNASRPLIGTSGHLSPPWMFLSLPGDVFHPEVIGMWGAPDVGKCIEEGVDARVRENAVSGKWHPLNVSLYSITKTLLGRYILSAAGDRVDMMHSVESRVSFLDHHLVDYVNTIPPSLRMKPFKTDSTGPSKWRFVEKWILRQAVQPFVTDEVYNRKKVQFNPPPGGPPPADVPAVMMPLQQHLKVRLTQEAVERLGFANWPYIRDTLNGYLTSPKFLPNGGMDPRARILMGLLSYVVLQERFNVPTYHI